jgi:YfiH family protein
MISMTGPQPSDGFEWTQAPWGAVLECAPLRAAARHFFTAATLRLREDEREWAAVAAFAGVDVDRLRLLHQVHGRHVVVATPGGQQTDRPEADAIISDDPSVALIVRVADCAPILMADRRRGVAAAVHAGWRSTMQRIVGHTVTALENTYGTNPEDLVVAIGPSLGTCCGEMGEEVVDAFRRVGHDDASLGRWFLREDGRRPHFDLWRANLDQLRAAGVNPHAVHVSGLCTRTYSEAFHSYRAEGQQAGRMAAVILANPVV